MKKWEENTHKKKGGGEWCLVTFEIWAIKRTTVNFKLLLGQDYNALHKSATNMSWIFDFL